MSDYEVHLGDEGTQIKITITEAGLPLDLTNATSIKIKFERKDRTTFMVDGAVFGDDPTLGIIECYSDDTYFTMKGEMKVQVFLVYNNGQWHTTTESFSVSENISVTA